MLVTEMSGDCDRGGDVAGGKHGAGRDQSGAEPGDEGLVHGRISFGLKQRRNPGRGLGGGRAPRTLYSGCGRQLAVSEVSSMTKLVCSEESSWPRNFTVTVLPLYAVR